LKSLLAKTLNTQTLPSFDAFLMKKIPDKVADDYDCDNRNRNESWSDMVTGRPPGSEVEA
jgi:hypothetical protein